MYYCILVLIAADGARGSCLPFEERDLTGKKNLQENHVVFNHLISFSSTIYTLMCLPSWSSRVHWKKQDMLVHEWETKIESLTGLSTFFPLNRQLFSIDRYFLSPQSSSLILLRRQSTILYDISSHNVLFLKPCCNSIPTCISWQHTSQ